MAGLSALKTIESIVDNYRNGETDSKSYFRDRELIKVSMLNQAGAMSPFLTGFISTLAEYIDTFMQDNGGPNLSLWKPESVMSEREIKAERAEMFRDHLAGDDQPTPPPATKMIPPPIPPRRQSYKSDGPYSNDHLLPFQTPDNQWKVQPTDDVHLADRIGMEYAAHYTQQLKDNPNIVCQNELGNIAEAINFADESAAKFYWIGYFTQLDHYIYRGVKNLNVWKDLDKRLEEQEALFAECDREEQLT